jgi:DNA processing protein
MTSPNPIDDPEQRAAYIALAVLPGLSAARLDALLAAFETPIGAISAPIAFLGTAGLSRGAAQAVAGATAAQGHTMLERARQLGATVLLAGDATFPRKLLDIPDPPRALFALGRLELLATNAVAVVGSREHTAYGVDACRKVVEAAVGADTTVVSGMARGIDARAHQHALDIGGATMGVLGNGLGITYPAANRNLYDRVSREGLLITEHPPGERPQVYTFPWRNRLIAGLASATVVVEAAHGSGALITATAALDQGSEVLAVPGPITSTRSDGCNALIRDGAAPFLRAEDLWSRLPLRAGFTPALPHVSVTTRLPDDLSELERRVASGLAPGEIDVDSLGGALGVAAGELLTALLSLELRGVVETRAGRRYRIKPV